MSLVLINKVF